MSEGACVRAQFFFFPAKVERSEEECRRAAEVGGRLERQDEKRGEGRGRALTDNIVVLRLPQGQTRRRGREGEERE